jgi:hydrogenase-4 component E
MLVRRRSLATLLVAAQALLLGVAALSLAGDRPTEFAVAAVILLIRAVALPALLAFTRRRTPEPYLVVPATTVLVRLLVSAVVVLVAVTSIPPLGLGDRPAEHGAVALLCLGIAIVVMRRPALLQVLGILVAENGIYLLAISAPGGLPSVDRAWRPLRPGARRDCRHRLHPEDPRRGGLGGHRSPEGAP